MSCLTATLTRVGGIQASASPVPSVGFGMERQGDMEVSFVPLKTKAELSRVGTVSESLEREGGCVASVERKGGCTVSLADSRSATAFSLEREGNMSVAMMDALQTGIGVTFVNAGGVVFRLEKICTTNVRDPYLEIEPTIVWVVDGWASNDVYSNTRWIVQ